MLGLYHRVDGVYGYQTSAGALQIIIRLPHSKVQKVEVFYDDPFNWTKNASGILSWNPTFQINLKVVNEDMQYQYYETQLKVATKRYRYYFKLETTNGQKWVYDQQGLKRFTKNYNGHQSGFAWAYSYEDKYISAPAWWKKTIWYQIFPSSFTSSFFKNGKLSKLQLIEKQLDYIQSLGFNGIYLNPLFTASSNHKYDTSNYLELDREFGTEQNLKALIKALKARKMYLMLDGVFNHAGSQFAPWLDVLKNQANSRYYDWFLINKITEVKNPAMYQPGEFEAKRPYEAFAKTPYMPKFNWNNADFRAYLKRVVQKWTAFGIDAWRLDVADEPGFNFWRFFRNTVHDINPRVAILGEVWTDAYTFLHGDMFDSVMNYPFRTNALAYFVDKTLTLTQFIDCHIKAQYQYSKPITAGLLNLLSSHDTPRLFNLVQGDQASLHHLLKWLFLNRGAVSFYYGDEHHLKGTNLDDNRSAINWAKVDLSNATIQLIRTLTRFRRDHFDLIEKGFKMLNRNERLVLEFTNGQQFNCG